MDVDEDPRSVPMDLVVQAQATRFELPDLEGGGTRWGHGRRRRPGYRRVTPTISV
jgi:hypothetical protein